MYANIQNLGGAEYSQSTASSQRISLIKTVDTAYSPVNSVAIKEMAFDGPLIDMDEIDEFEEALTPEEAISRQLNPGEEMSTVTGVEGNEQDEEAGDYKGDSYSLYMSDDYLELEEGYLSKALESDGETSASYQLHEEGEEAEQFRSTLEEEFEGLDEPETPRVRDEVVESDEQDIIDGAKEAEQDYYSLDEEIEEKPKAEERDYETIDDGIEKPKETRCKAFDFKKIRQPAKALPLERSIRIAA